MRVPVRVQVRTQMWMHVRLMCGTGACDAVYRACRRAGCPETETAVVAEEVRAVPEEALTLRREACPRAHTRQAQSTERGEAREGAR